MRIDKLAIISPWKNLGGFTIDFDESRDVAVLLGRNGSAKSNLIEALIQIFQSLDRNEAPPFSYTIDYQLGKHRVSVFGEADKKSFKATVDDKSVAAKDIRSKWLPEYLVGYYSGTSDRFKELFYPYDRQALEQTLTDKAPNDSLELRRFIYARPEHGLFALLAFYFSDDKEVVKFLNDLPRIEAFDSLLIELHKPYWANNKARVEDFWGAKGPVRSLLEAIKRHSLAPFSRTVRLKKDFTRNTSTEVLYLYLPDLNALHALAEEYGHDPKVFFQALDTMRLSDLIDESSFRVKVRVKGVSGAIHTRQLSEGEQQLLTVLGLMRFTRNENSLYLLDEPDTHLNPAWGVEYLDRLRKVGGIEQKSHTILATHDPLLVAGLCKEEIRVLKRTEEGRVTAIMPEESPRGTGVASVLTSPLFGLESQLDSFSLKVLKRIYEVSLEEGSPNRKRHLKRLRQLVPDLAPNDPSPDPYRNIARLAYEITANKIVEANKSTDWKSQAVEKLSSKLYADTGE